MPYGIESDQYAILGEILDCRLEQNNLTGENVWVLDICCNEMNFGVCINQKDLVGEPQVGRRFKGIVWMQGSIKMCIRDRTGSPSENERYENESQGVGINGTQ